MKTSIECLECLASMYGNLVMKSSKDEKHGYEAICKITKEIGRRYKNGVPADIGTVLNKILMGYFGDTFIREKKECTKKALEIFNAFRNTENTLEFAIKMALFGNIMDYSVKSWDPTLINPEMIIKEKIAINHINYLEKELNKAKNLLYLTDNAGEVVLDYFLIKYIKSKGIKVILSPKQAPIQNDATLEDFTETPIPGMVDKIIPTAQAVGLNLCKSSKKFKKEFTSADIIIFKGMGYFENAFDVNCNGFFILKAKCEPVARILGVKRGDNIVLGRKYHSK